MSKRALVTGATGFVGAVLARRLVEDGHDVHLVARPGSDPWRLDGVDAETHEAELADETRVAEVVSSVRPEWIFHLATHGAYPAQTDAARMLESNVVGTTHLVRAALAIGFDSFVNTGSSSEYGFCERPPDETELPEPNSAYAWTKLTQTHFCRLTAREHACHIPTLRLYSVYGPYEEPSRLIPTLIAHGLDGRYPPLASPDVARDFVYCDDVVRAFLLAAANTDVAHGTIYNVGSGVQTTLREAVGLARETFDIAAEPEWQSMPDRTWDTTTWVANADKIQSELGWSPSISFEDGFRRFKAWIGDRRAPYRA